MNRNASTFKGKVVRHFKGMRYLCIGIALNTETDEHEMVYMALYDEYKLLTRPLTMFMSKVDKEKYPDAKQEFRFELEESGVNE